MPLFNPWKREKLKLFPCGECREEFEESQITKFVDDEGKEYPLCVRCLHAKLDGLSEIFDNYKKRLKEEKDWQEVK
jgi:hypothetical protein